MHPELISTGQTLNELVEELAYRGPWCVVIAAATVLLPDCLGSVPDLRCYECFAAVERWHQAAAYDFSINGVKIAVGHF